MYYCVNGNISDLTNECDAVFRQVLSVLNWKTEFSQFEEEGRRHGMVGIIQEVHLVDG